MLQHKAIPDKPPLLYQFIFILCSISVWKSGTWRSSEPMIMC